MFVQPWSFHSAKRVSRCLQLNSLTLNRRILAPSAEVKSSFLSKAVEPSFYERLNRKDAIDRVHFDQYFLRNFKTFTTTTLPGGITAVEFVEDIDKNAMIALAPKVLFVRDFYNDLLAAIRSEDWRIPLGNPGISKSCFQYY